MDRVLDDIQNGYLANGYTYVNREVRIQKAEGFRHNDKAQTKEMVTTKETVY